jgi:nitroimidazol reductase NimA-like FMN-containing flavoprotein (pyridoxamine 5'-phosphate oxidase superfamily)
MPRVLTESERERFLTERHVAVLSVAAEDGRPPASVPIWYHYSPGGNIRINTDASRRKAKLIKRAGVLTLVVQREEPPYTYVVVEGTVVDAARPVRWRHAKPSLAAISARRADANGCAALAITTACCSPSAPSVG